MLAHLSSNHVIVLPDETDVELWGRDAQGAAYLPLHSTRSSTPHLLAHAAVMHRALQADIMLSQQCTHFPCT